MTSELNELLKQAIALAQAGQREEARDLLKQIVTQDPTLPAAWLWLATVATDENERISALLRVLELDPGNQTARIALDKLGVIVPASNVPPAQKQRGNADSLPSWLHTDIGEASPRPERPFLSQRELTIVLVMGFVAVLLVLSLFVGRELVTDLLATDTPTITNTPTPRPTFTPSLTVTPVPTNTYPPTQTLPPEFTRTPTFTPTETREPRPTFTSIPSRTPFVRPTREPIDPRIFGG